MFRAVVRMKRPPKKGARNVPSELNACVRLSRLDAVSGFPKTVTYGLAATCRQVIPAANTIRAPRNNGYDGTLAAGTNKNAPKPITNKPPTIERWDPIQSVTLAGGIEARQ